MGEKDILNGMDYRIIRSYANNNMKIYLTAQELHYTDGTINYHLKKVKRLTGLDPWNFWDLHKLCDLLKEWRVDE